MAAVVVPWKAGPIGIGETPAGAKSGSIQPCQMPEIKAIKYRYEYDGFTAKAEKVKRWSARIHKLQSYLVLISMESQVFCNIRATPIPLAI